jgi:hypothetical protein
LLSRFKICRDCYIDAQKETGQCPGCKELYKVRDYEDDASNFSSGVFPLPAPGGLKRDANNMSMMKANHSRELDHNQWLFETKGTYGVGSAFWPEDDTYVGDEDDGFKGGAMESMDKPWKPLSRKLPIPASIISPYRSSI